MNRPQPILLVLLLFLGLGVVAQLIPLYTDWLWFNEVGYSQVFVKTLSLRSSLFMAMSIGVLVFLYANLMFAARTAAPDVIWELEDQLGLPSRVIIEPLIRRFLPIVLLVIALASGVRATVHWETVLGYLNATPFGTVDPLFGYDLSFFVFTLPMWRLVHGWLLTLVTATIVLTLAIYVLQRSLVLTSRGPRLAAAPRTSRCDRAPRRSPSRRSASGSTGSSWSSPPAVSCLARPTPTSTPRCRSSARSRYSPRCAPSRAWPRSRARDCGWSPAG